MDNELSHEASPFQSPGLKGGQVSFSGSVEDSKAAQVTSSTTAADLTTPYDDLPKHLERGLRFWMCIVAIMVASFLMVLDLVDSVSLIKYCSRHSN